MSTDRRRRQGMGIRVAAVAALAAAGWYSLDTIQWTGKRMQSLDRKAFDLRTLQALESGGDERRAAKSLLEALPSGEPSFVQSVASRILGDVGAEIQEAEPASLGDGWMLRTVKVSMDGVPLKDAMRLVAALEAERPPWRPRTWSIEAVPERKGWGRVRMTLEALHRERL